MQSGFTFLERLFREVSAGYAGVAESVDAADLKSVSHLGVGVRVPPPAPAVPLSMPNKLIIEEILIEFGCGSAR